MGTKKGTAELRGNSLVVHLTAEEALGLGLRPRWYYTDVPGETRVACLHNDDEYICPKCAKDLGIKIGDKSIATWERWEGLAPDMNPEKYCDRCGDYLLRNGD